MHARTILWAQWRTLRNYYPRAGVAWTAIVGLIWYGFWLVAAFSFARIFSESANLPVIRNTLPSGLLIVVLYWQIIPLLTAATGASLEMRKLRVYPIPESQLFWLEVLLRITTSIEMFLVLGGVTVGTLLNPALPKWALIVAPVYIILNLFIAVGVRDLVSRILARKRIREAVFFLLVLSAALPQLLIARRGPRGLVFLRALGGESWHGWPWTAAANLIQGRELAFSSLVLTAWTLVAAVFGYWQFSRTLKFDLEAASAGSSKGNARAGIMELFYRVPSVLLPDPIGALIEKELRSMIRAPRFRLVFLMGFTFGLIIWLPMAFGRGRAGIFGDHYLTVVSIYSLFLLSEVCFWNSFGFDRSAAQFYFLAPIRFTRVLIAKNLTAILFVLLEISAVTAVCALLRLPITFPTLMEAFGVAAVISIFLLSAGNLMSVRNARGVDPGNSIRSGAAGRVQAMLFVIYPIAFIPVALAFLARYAFESDAAFYGVLALDAIFGLIVYKLALDSAAQAAVTFREKMLGALSANSGPIAD